MTLRWLFIGSLILLALGVLIQPLGDPDVYLHLRDGRYFSEHGWKAASDPFSYTAADQALDRVEMVFRAGLYAAWKAGGYHLLIALKAAVMTTAFFLLGVLLYQRWPNAGAAGLLLLGSILIPLALMPPLTRFFHERPYVFTYLFLPLVMLILDDYRQADQAAFPKTARRLWFLPALILVWVNLHPAFFVAVAFLGAHIAEDAWLAWRQPSPFRSKRLRTTAAVLGVCLLAGALNPMGFGIYSYIFWHLLPNAFMTTITEYAPPTWAQAPFFFLLLGLVWLFLLLTPRALRLSDLIPLAGLSYMALKSYRNIPLFWFAALPPLAGYMRAWQQRLFPNRRLPAPVKTLCLALGTMLILGGTGWLARQGSAWRWGEFPEYHPAAGLDWLTQQGWQGRLFALDRWGGYIGWKTDGRLKVFMDGRLKLFGEKVYADYRRIVYGSSVAPQILDHYRVEGVLASPQTDLRLYRQLWQSGKWALVYWDDVCLLYVRRGGANQRLLEAFEYKRVDPNRSPYYDPARLPASWQELERAVETAPGAYSPLYLKGDLLLRTNHLAEARQIFIQVLRLSPRHLGSHYQLGLLALRENRWQEAEPYLRFVIRQSPEPSLRGQAEYYLAFALSQDPGRRAEAGRRAQKARTLLPGWQPAEALARELGVQ